MPVFRDPDDNLLEVHSEIRRCRPQDEVSEAIPTLPRAMGFPKRPTRPAHGH